MVPFEPPPRVNVLGVGISVLNLDTALDLLARAVASGVRGYVTLTTVNGVIYAQESEGLRQIQNRALLTTPDGMPMVWMGRWSGYREMGRVYGPEVMDNLLARSPRTGETHFFYGGKPGIAEKLKAVFEARYPGARIVGTYCPPFRPLNAQEQAELKAQVAAVKPDFFWVGISCPKQEWFMAENLDRLDAKIFLGVGAAFDFHTGTIRQAPRWIQRSGFEWLFRVCAEPRRLIPRYAHDIPLFLWKIAGQLTGLRRVPSIESAT